MSTEPQEVQSRPVPRGLGRPWAALGRFFGPNPLLWWISGTVLVFVVWASVFPLDVASYAQGQVIPSGQLKKIQHLEGGIIRTINVSEGQQVKAGQVIAELEAVAANSDVSDFSGRTASMEAKALRITASLARAPALQLPANLERGYPEIAKDARSSFASYRDRYNAILQTNTSKIAQRQAEIQEARERLAGLRNRSKMVAQQVKISEEMLKRSLTNEYEHLTLKKEQAQIDADLNSTVATEKRAMTALDEANAALAAFKYEEDVNLRKELQDTNLELTSLRERSKKPADSQDRTVVRSPVDGNVMTIFFKNKGAVVSPGGTLATLVPLGDTFLIEAKLPISEVGYVGMGAPARLSITSGGSGFSTVQAKVVHISPDAAADEKTGATYYVVRLAPEVPFFKRGSEVYEMRPGVQVTAAILTGQRSVLALLLEPLTGAQIHPLSER